VVDALPAELQRSGSPFRKVFAFNGLANPLTSGRVARNVYMGAVLWDLFDDQLFVEFDGEKFGLMGWAGVRTLPLP